MSATSYQQLRNEASSLTDGIDSIRSGAAKPYVAEICRMWPDPSAATDYMKDRLI